MTLRGKPKENINTWLEQFNEESQAAISVDCVIFGYDLSSLKILLIDCDMPPHIGKKSLIGDLISDHETLDQAAHRVITNFTGLKNLHISQVKAFADPKRHPLGRVLTVAYFTLIKIDNHAIIDAKNRGLVWKDVTGIKKLAFDHYPILKESISLLRHKVRRQPIGFQLLPKKFTLQQLQNLYEIVLGVNFDKRNFRRKLRSLDLLIELDEFKEGHSYRPAKLYSFNQKKYEKMMQSRAFKFEI